MKMNNVNITKIEKKATAPVAEAAPVLEKKAEGENTVDQETPTNKDAGSYDGGYAETDDKDGDELIWEICSHCKGEGKVKTQNPNGGPGDYDKGYADPKAEKAEEEKVVPVKAEETFDALKVAKSGNRMFATSEDMRKTFNTAMGVEQLMKVQAATNPLAKFVKP